jgi:hypothetical protein
MTRPPTEAASPAPPVRSVCHLSPLTRQILVLPLNLRIASLLGQFLAFGRPGAERFLS